MPMAPRLVRLRRREAGRWPVRPANVGRDGPGPYEIVCPGCGDDPSRDWWRGFPGSCAGFGGISAMKAGAGAALVDDIARQTR